MNYIPYLWLIVGVVFIIAELMTPGFVLLWFGIGALAAGVLGFLGAGLALQISAFLILSVALTIASRTIFEKFFMRNAPGSKIRIGMDSLPGQVGVVVEQSRGPLQEAAVKVYGSTWTAYPMPGEGPLREGDQVQVERVDGTVLHVRKIPRSVSWRNDPLPPTSTSDSID